MNPFVRRLIITLLVLLAIVAGLLIFFRVFPVQRPTAPPTTTSTPSGGLPSAGLAATGPAAGAATSAAGANAPVAPAGATVVQASEAELTQNSLVVLGRDFAERYGSYSSDGNYENLEAVLPLLTDQFRARITAQISKSRAAASTGSFYGVITKALSVKVTGTETKTTPAKLRVLTQRTASSGGPTAVTYEELELLARFDGVLWKVDSATWVKP